MTYRNPYVCCHAMRCPRSELQEALAGHVGKEEMEQINAPSAVAHLYSASSMASSQREALSGSSAPPGASQRSRANSTVSSIDSYSRK